MKKIYIVLLSILTLIVIVAVVAGSYLKLCLPDVKAPEIKIEKTAARVERGRYLAHNVAVCMDCHSSRDWSHFAAPLSGNLGGGGEVFGRAMGFPGTIYSPNITPHNLGDWTDGEVYRAITSGVSKDGRALFGVMPYHHYGQMDQEDIYSIIAYIRTLLPIASETPLRELDFPVNFLVNTMPKVAQPHDRPSESDRVAYGGYLVNTAGCVDCHSKMSKGAIVQGSEFGGGMEFRQPKGIVRSPNITAHKETGIGLWSQEAFVKRFKQYAAPEHIPTKLTAQDLNSPMPWYMYAGMKETDLEAIYAYLSSLDPINNLVNRYEKEK